MYPSNNAATRTFCELPAELLGRAGIPSRVFAPSSAETKGRLRHPDRILKALGAAVYWNLIVLPRRLWQLPSILSRRVIFIQRSMFRYNSPPILEALVSAAARLSGAKVIYHLDDALYEVARPSFVRFRGRRADLLLTGNLEIAAWMRSAGARVELLDGWVQTERYAPRSYGDKPQPVIGYVGSSPAEDLEPINAVLREVCLETGARLVVVGPEAAPIEALAGIAEVRAWTPESEFSLFDQFDLGVMPLTNSAYDRGREAFKLKEYMAAGLPAVASAVGHCTRVVEHGRDGLLAGSEQEWRAHLRALVGDPDLRERLGRAGREKVSRNYDAGRQIGRLEQIIRRVAAGQ